MNLTQSKFCRFFSLHGVYIVWGLDVDFSIMKLSVDAIVRPEYSPIDAILEFGFYLISGSTHFTLDYIHV